MFKLIKIEHTIAILLAGALLLVDIAIMCFMSSMLRSDTNIIPAPAATEHRVIHTPVLSVNALICPIPGKSTNEAVDGLEQIILRISNQNTADKNK